MKTIVVAIDFSDCSINALEHALSIARNAKKNILMVWVNKDPKLKDKFEENGKDVSREVIKQFDELIKKYKDDLPEGCKITYKIRTGKVYKEIVAEAVGSDAFLVVTGTHGASGFEEFWIGSNANKIISESPCPVITIRHSIDIHRPLRKIVCPLDSTLETRQKVPLVAYLATTNDAVVHLLCIYTSKVKAMIRQVDGYADQVEKYFVNEGVKYKRDAIFVDNITDGTIDYAKKVDANLIAIMTEQETTTANIWLGTYASQMVNRSSFPVLSVRSKQLLIAATN